MKVKHFPDVRRSVLGLDVWTPLALFCVPGSVCLVFVPCLYALSVCLVFVPCLCALCCTLCVCVCVCMYVFARWPVYVLSLRLVSVPRFGAWLGPK